MPLKAIMTQKTEQTNILVYALKSDDGERPTKNQYPGAML